VVTGALALVAGASPARAATLGVAMLALQVSIGALNDVSDVALDRGRKSGKPIPAGLVGEGTARVVVAGGLAVGLGLSAAIGPATVAVAVAGTAAGYAYDLRLKATAWAWLPFAIGLPLLPVYAWVGATGQVPAPFALLVPLGLLAGAAVALLNGLVDIERDRAAGVATPATRLGHIRSRRLAAVLLSGVAAGVAGSLAAIGADLSAWILGLAGLGSIVAGLVLVGSSAADRRERGWEAAAVGLGLLAAGWAVGFAGQGLL
jgi:4-hydroxybenzoate polyprenyltransferase